MALRRFLVLEQETETAWCPDWYSTFQAAKYLNVAPWDLIEHSIWYQDKASIAMTAEYQAQEIKNKQQK